MARLPKSIEALIEEFSKLPGIGPKTAARLVFYLLSKAKEDVEKLGETVKLLQEGLTTCQICYNFAETSPCSICEDSNRKSEKVCVVEEPLDVIALEKTGFDGVYHVLGGVISPMNGIGPEDIRIKELVERVKKGRIEEIILATDPSLEGEATAMYIYQKIVSFKVKISRIARGLPVGGDLEYADELTLTRALEARTDFSQNFKK